MGLAPGEHVHVCMSESRVHGWSSCLVSDNHSDTESSPVETLTVGPRNQQLQILTSQKENNLYNNDKQLQLCYRDQQLPNFLV